MNLQKISLPEIHGSSNKTFTILECLPGHLHHLGCLRNPLHRLRISLQSTSIFLECLPGHMHHLGCLRNPLHHLWISSRPSLPYISRPISGHRHQHCMAQNPAMRSCNSPGSGYPSTDTCGYGSACRYPHFGGTWQQGYRHTYLYWHIDCQVNCTKDHDERPAWMKYTSSPAGMHLD